MQRSVGNRKRQQAPAQKKITVNTTPSSMPMYSSYLVDPLNSPVVGKPDENAVSTVATRFRDVYVITSDATGQAAFACYNSTDVNSTFPAPAITGSSITNFGAGQASGYNASILADAVYTRGLAMVVEWMPTGSTNTASGRIFMGQYNGSPPIQALGAYFDDEGMTCPATEYAVAVTRPTGSLPFLPPGTNQPINHPCQVVVLTGLAPSQQVGQIVVTRAVEYEPSGVTLAKGYSMHTPCDMTDCCCSANLVGKKVTTGWGPNAYKTIVSAGYQILKAAMAMYPGYSAGPARALMKLIAG